MDNERGVDTDRFVLLQFYDRLGKIEVPIEVNGVVTDKADEDEVELVDDPHYDDVKLTDFHFKKARRLRKPKRVVKSRAPFGKTTKPGSGSTDSSVTAGETTT